MKSHLTTIILLPIAVIAFGLRFIVNENLQNYCDIAAFALPTLAAVAEIVVSERRGEETNDQITKLKEKQLSARVEDETLTFDQGE